MDEVNIVEYDPRWQTLFTVGLTQKYTRPGAIHELPLRENKGFGYCLRKSCTEEAERIWQALGNDLVVEIEHIGSTAVPGMAAKPVIDIMVGVRSLINAKSAIPALESLGYVYWREDPRPGRMFFVKGMPPYGKQRTHHVHIVEIDSEFWERKLFCDYLRKHPEEAKRYEALKRDLAASYRSDREAYTSGKNDYIRAVMVKARCEDMGKSQSH